MAVMAVRLALGTDGHGWSDEPDPEAWVSRRILGESDQRRLADCFQFIHIESNRLSRRVRNFARVTGVFDVDM